MKVSVAMATYNGEKYIREQIESILNQTCQDFEIIICDDCSTDSTFSILQEYEQIDKRIHAYLNDTNIGVVKNFEKAVNLCKANYIALSDQDDIWTNDHLETLLNNESGCMLVCAQSEVITKNGSRTGKILQSVEKSKFLTRQNNSNDLFLLLLLFGNFAQGCTMLINRQLLKRALPIPEMCSVHDFWFALCASVYEIKFVDKIIVLYRQHENNIINHLPPNHITRIERIKHKLLTLNSFTNICKYIFTFYARKKCEYQMEYKTKLERLHMFFAIFGSELDDSRLKIFHSTEKYMLSIVNGTDKIYRIRFLLKNFRLLHWHEDKHSIIFKIKIILKLCFH